MNTLRKILAAGLLSGLSLGGSAALAAETDTLVVYFSATGRTEVAAEAIAAELKADTFALNPAVPYSVKDLDYRDPESRSSKEHQDPSIKPEYTGDVADWNKYGTVYIGYPIWWGEAPNIVYTFAEKHDFCSEHLAAKAGAGSWKPGKGFSSSVNTAEVKKWARESR